MDSLPSTNPDPASATPADGPTPSPDATTADGPVEASPVKVDITVAGHTVVIEAHRRMEDVAALALHLIGRTAGYARRMPYGFDTSHADTQLADVDDPSSVTARRTPGSGVAG